MRFLSTTICGFALLLKCVLAPCNPAAAQSSPPSSRAAATAQPIKSSLGKAATAPKIKFHPYEVIDEKQGGMTVSRLAVPGDWKNSSSVIWNYNDFYLPVHVYARTEAPDGGSWIEFFPAEFFLWLDAAHDRAPVGRGGIGGIHHPNITLQEAMVRYVIAPNRANAKNLRIVGSRPVNDLPKEFSHLFTQGMPQGEGICMRVSYELNGSPVDEEFYGFMTALETIPAPSPNPRLSMIEYHRRLILAHSMGAKAGKLESVRPLLGFVATSIDPNPAWQQRLAAVYKAQHEVYQRVQAANYAEIQAAGQRSRALTAQSDQFLRQVDANLAAQNNTRNAASSGFSSSANDDFYKRADDFDQNIRGTEHMQDQNGVVTDQYTDYNYHWTDGFGRFVHTDDPNFDPNRYLTGSYQQMTPAAR
jgi:hypothetical protein